MLLVRSCLLAALATIACDDSDSKVFYPAPAVGRGLQGIEKNEPAGEEDVAETPKLTPEEMAEAALAELRSAGGDHEAVHQSMQENFVRADQLQKAVIAGDLKEARETARWIASHSVTGGLPPGWIAHVTAMRRAAQAVADSRDIEAAARSTAFVAGACGSCHLTQLGGAQIGGEPMPMGEEGLELSMRRHQWAADRLWDAVVSGEGGRWDEGVAVLAESELVRGDFGAKPAQRQRVEGLLRRFRGIVKRAQGAVAPDVRVQVLGEFLGSCSGCHRLLRRGPAAW